jgi:hypothetical protein
MGCNQLGREVSGCLLPLLDSKYHTAAGFAATTTSIYWSPTNLFIALIFYLSASETVDRPFHGGMPLVDAGGGTTLSVPPAGVRSLAAAARDGLRIPLLERRLADALLRALVEGDGGVAGMRSLAVRGGLRRPLPEGDERVDTDGCTTLPVPPAGVRSLAAAARDGLRIPLPERRLADAVLRALPEGDGGVAGMRSLAAAAARGGLRRPLLEGDARVDTDGRTTLPVLAAAAA